MSYLLLQMLLYMLGAFLLGLLLGWIIWGRLSVRLSDAEREIAALRAERDALRRPAPAAPAAGNADAALIAERDRLKAQLAAAQKPGSDLDGLKADRDSLRADLDACAKARADLEKRLAAGAEAEGVGLLGRPAAAPVARATAATSSAPAAPAKRDDLRELIGVGPKNEQLLNEQGVTTFAQIAAWTADDIRRIEEVLAFDGRIERERWVEQAKFLAAGDIEGFHKAFPNAGKDSNT